MDFTVPPDYREKINERGKIDKDFNLRTVKTWSFLVLVGGAKNRYNFLFLFVEQNGDVVSNFGELLYFHSPWKPVDKKRYVHYSFWFLT